MITLSRIRLREIRLPLRAPFRISSGVVSDRRITLRLVKGAYWDSEIKRAQERGLAGYPVFTRKPNTDVSYLACAKLLESAGERIYPQFATHNAHTIAHVAELFGGDSDRFEFQRLHGMGAELYDGVVRGPWGKHACRVYAPVGAHEDLLPYLVRRLLENGANTSFVNRIVDASLPAEEVVADPIAEVDSLERVAHPRIPLPVNLFAPERANSSGFNFADGHSEVHRWTDERLIIPVRRVTIGTRTQAPDCRDILWLQNRPTAVEAN